MTDEQYMKIALELSEKGCGYVNPNPIVGCVIVKDGKIISQGYHKKYGDFHAERNALDNCTVPAKGATLYVTLEPCRHYGKTPPCTEAIIESGVARVVIGCRDPNTLAGGGADILKANGIEVDTGVLEQECLRSNETFFHFIKTGTPYVVMKYAMTMDGKIATKTGISKWITGDAARMRVHRDRHRYSAIMVGLGTVIADDPLLTCRIEDGRNPIRIICDTSLRTPLSSQIVMTANDIPTIIATACRDSVIQNQYRNNGCRIINVPQKDGHIDLNELMLILGSEGIDSILLEGGGTLNWSAVQSCIVNKVQTYIAPKIFGGTANSPVSGDGIGNTEDAFMLKNTGVYHIDGDILIESEVIKLVHGNN